MYRALEAACAAYASLNLSLLHYITLRCVCSAAREALGRIREEERGGGILCCHAHSLLFLLLLIMENAKLMSVERNEENEREDNKNEGKERERNSNRG